MSSFERQRAHMWRGLLRWRWRVLGCVWGVRAACSVGVRVGHFVRPSMRSSALADERVGLTVDANRLFCTSLGVFWSPKRGQSPS